MSSGKAMGAGVRSKRASASAFIEATSAANRSICCERLGPP